MLNKTVKLIGFTAIALLLASCARIVPVENFHNQPVPQGLSSHQVKKAIEEGTKIRGWHTVSAKPGLIKATVLVRGHQASINIPYSSRSYSITYQSSHNLLYKNGKIHRNYNRWVSKLNNNIQYNLNRQSIQTKHGR